MTETVYNLIKTKSSIIFLSVDQFTVNLSSIQATLSVNLFHKTNWLLHMDNIHLHLHLSGIGNL